MTPILCTRTLYELLQHASHALARVCDGAEIHDDQSVAGGDRKTGQLLAFLPLDARPPAAIHRVWRWRGQDHRQLERMQCDCMTSPEPPVFEGKECQIALNAASPSFLVVFACDPTLIEAFQRIPGNAFHMQQTGQGKQVFRYRTARLVSGTSAALLAFAEQYDFHLAPGVDVVVLARSFNDTTIWIQDNYCIVCDPFSVQAFVLYVSRNLALNQEVNAIPGKSFCDAGDFHRAIPASPTVAGTLCAFIERHLAFSLSTEGPPRLRRVAPGNLEARVMVPIVPLGRGPPRL